MFVDENEKKDGVYTCRIFSLSLSQHGMTLGSEHSVLPQTNYTCWMSCIYGNRFTATPSAPNLTHCNGLRRMCYTAYQIKMAFITIMGLRPQSALALRPLRVPCFHTPCKWLPSLWAVCDINNANYVTDHVLLSRLDNYGTSPALTHNSTCMLFIFTWLVAWIPHESGWDVKLYVFYLRDCPSAEKKA